MSTDQYGNLGGCNVYLWPGFAAKATSVALLPEATPTPTSATPVSPRRQVAGNEGFAPTRPQPLSLADRFPFKMLGSRANQ